jgi:UDP-N-acetylglucosamine diphosphorylase / glucose-1-phosphate thymidylyltransferase / UDP-N-acetylgalactosamine diphosphorylase / glucosamine-1-phosphate N-acetyltransferase / galactosamine-1-phosphate N-acetyltransferase
MGNPKQAIILAAGKGTRLGAITKGKPKALVEVGGRALIDHLRNGLAKAGVTHTVVVVSHFAEQVEAHLKNYPIPGQTARTVWQPVPQGTGQACRLAVPNLDDGPTWITYADILVEPSEYVKMAQAFSADDCDLTLAVFKVDDPHQGAAVYTDSDRRIKKIIEKPKKGTSTTNLNSAGIYIARPSLFPHLNALLPTERGEYELPDAISALIQTEGDARAYTLDGWWADVGRPDDLDRMNQLLKQRGKPDA